MVLECLQHKQLSAETLAIIQPFLYKSLQWKEICSFVQKTKYRVLRLTWFYKTTPHNFLYIPHGENEVFMSLDKLNLTSTRRFITFENILYYVKNDNSNS